MKLTKSTSSILIPNTPITVYDNNWTRFDGVFLEETTDNKLCMRDYTLDENLYLPLSNISTITFYLHQQ